MSLFAYGLRVYFPYSLTAFLRSARRGFTLPPIQPQEGEVMPKITLVGAGSVIFTRNLVGDILACPELAGSTISLMDIDPERLRVAHRLCELIVETLGVSAKVESSLDRRQALDGAGYVINTIQVGGYSATLADFDIPENYGVKQTIADTLGVGGVFRALRSIPVLLDICKDMEDVAPGAWLLNYSNPMAMNCWAVYKSTNVPIIGLCHSVQGSTRQMAEYIGAPYEEIRFQCAGINHMAWVHDFRWNGNDAYPLLYEAMENPEIYKKDKVRFEIMRRFGCFVTESSEHMSEYVPYFIKTPDLVEKLDIPIREYVKRCDDILEEFDAMTKLVDGGGAIDVERSLEYASVIIEAHQTGKPAVIWGNVENTGLIGNLPLGCCVEVPILIDGHGMHPCYSGTLPPQLAALNRTNIHVQEQTVIAALEKSRKAVEYAVMLDPHTSSILSMDRIVEMVDEMLTAHAEYLPEYS